MNNFAKITIDAFKAYDVRGELGKHLNETIVYRIARACAELLAQEHPEHPNPAIVIGADIRPSSLALKTAAIDGILDAGVDVIDLGMTGTEEVYFATSHLQAIAGIEITASHNPLNYNGMKFVKSQSRPLGIDTGLKAIQDLAQSGEFINPSRRGNYSLRNDKQSYIDHLLSYINPSQLKPLKLVVNCGNGSAGPVIDLVQERLLAYNAPIEFIKIHHAPDGSFPNGIPNPMLIKNRHATSQAVLSYKADLGIAFDGDFDRCFLFDEMGRFVEGSYVVGVLAQAFLQKNQGATIVYEPRNLLNTEQVIEQFNGVGIVSKSGHSYIKATMRHAKAVYGGEMSAHHYFKDFNYCDSGMIPWLLIVELLSQTNQKLSDLVTHMMTNFPSSGEINFALTHTHASQLLQNFENNLHRFDCNPSVNHLDGLSVNYPTWRFNVRASNTEPLLRLNVESRGDIALLECKLKLLCDFISQHGGKQVDH